jgi:hypothetical protein
VVSDAGHTASLHRTATPRTASRPRGGDIEGPTPAYGARRPASDTRTGRRRLLTHARMGPSALMGSSNETLLPSAHCDALRIEIAPAAHLKCGRSAVRPAPAQNRRFRPVRALPPDSAGEFAASGLPAGGAGRPMLPDPAGLVPPHRDLHPVPGAELGHEAAADVGLHRAEADVQLGRAISALVRPRAMVSSTCSSRSVSVSRGWAGGAARPVLATSTAAGG